MDGNRWFKPRNGKIEVIGGPPLEIPSILVDDSMFAPSHHAEVFRGIDSEQRSVWVKVWKHPYTPDVIDRATTHFAKLAAAIKSYGPFAYEIYKFDATPDPVNPGCTFHYIISEDVDGKRADSWPTNQTDAPAAFRLWQSVIAALTILHRAGIYHGDPHRGNIVVVNDSPILPVIKLIDFGSMLKWPTEADPFFEDRDIRMIADSLFKDMFPDIYDKSPDHQYRHNRWPDPQAALIAINELLQRHQ